MLPATADDWLEYTEDVAGSRWPFWIEWAQVRSGAPKAAPEKLGGQGYEPGWTAPGIYVLEQA